MKRNYLALATLLALLGAGATASGDVITLTDGSRLIGSITRLQDGKIKIETQFAGTLEIEASLIKSIETEEAVNIGVDSGDRLVGQVEWQPATEQAVIHSEVGDVPVPIERISAIWPEGAPSPEEVVLEQQLEQAKKDYEARMAKWELVMEAGLVFTEGNTETFNARGAITATRKSHRDLLRFYLLGAYAEENKRRSRSEVMGGMYYEYLFTERLFAYGRLDLEYDEFENLDLRLSTVVGAGYYWLKKDDHEFKTRGGVGYLHETYMDNTQRDAAQAELGFDYRLDVAPWMRFTNSSTWYPTFDGLDDYRLVSDSAFVFPLGDGGMWSLKLGAKYEYKSIPAAGRERLDQIYYGNIVLTIK